METDKTTDKAKALIDAIFDDHFTGPKQLAQSYREKTYSEDLSMLGMMKSQHYRQAIDGKKKSSQAAGADGVIRTMSRKIKEHENRRKEMKARLSDDILKTLKNYSQEHFNKLVDTLIDFEEAVALSKSTSVIFGVVQQIHRRCKLAIKGADLLLTSGYLSDGDIKNIRALRSVHAEMLPIDGIYLSTDQVVKLKKTFLANTRGLEYAYENWADAWILSVLRHQYFMERGRPQDMIFKALQIVIYETLKGKAQQRKKLAANIINKAYQRFSMKQLTAKHIDNALHSS